MGLPTTVTVDASVVLNAFNPAEDGHHDSRSALARLEAAAIPILVPNLLRVEVAGAVARGRDDADLATRFVDTLLRLPDLLLMPLDDRLAATAAGLAADHRLRGADAIYGAVALRFGSTLVSRDREQLERLAPAVSTLHPGDLR